MKIPANKVRAQMWADRARSRLGSLEPRERACLERWDASKQVYRVNDALWDELTLDDADALPVSVLRRLPYDCIFVQHREVLREAFPLAGLTAGAEFDIAGFFCWLDAAGLNVSMLFSSSAVFPGGLRDPPHDRCGYLTTIGPDAPATIGELTKSIESRGYSTTKSVLSRLSGVLPETFLVNQAEEHVRRLSISNSLGLKHLLGALMYISSKEADVRTVYVPQRNRPQKSRQTDCEVHDVGFRVADRLGRVRRIPAPDTEPQANQEPSSDGVTRRHLAPHVRRAHWHGYWTGPRDNPTGLEIKWIPPIIVNASRGDLMGTVHKVSNRDGRPTLSSMDRQCRDSASALSSDGDSRGEEMQIHPKQSR